MAKFLSVKLVAVVNLLWIYAIGQGWRAFLRLGSNFFP